MNTLIIGIILASGLSDCKAGRYESGLQKLDAIEHLVKSEKKDEVLFFRMCAQFALRDRRCIASATDLIDSFGACATRYVHVATLIKSTASRWNDEVSLENIGDKMKDVARRIELDKPGEDVIKKQQDIVKDLDKLIKDEEDSRKKKKDKQESDEEPTKIVEGEDSNIPLDDSEIRKIIGNGVVDEKKMGSIMEQWGKLPPAKRAQIINGIQMQYPEKYRVQIEEYKKALDRSR